MRFGLGGHLLSSGVCTAAAADLSLRKLKLRHTTVEHEEALARQDLLNLNEASSTSSALSVSGRARGEAPLSDREVQEALSLGARAPRARSDLHLIGKSPEERMKQCCFILKSGTNPKYGGPATFLPGPDTCEDPFPALHQLFDPERPDVAISDGLFPAIDYSYGGTMLVNTGLDVVTWNHCPTNTEEARRVIKDISDCCFSIKKREKEPGDSASEDVVETFWRSTCAEYMGYPREFGTAKRGPRLLVRGYPPKTGPKRDQCPRNLDEARQLVREKRYLPWPDPLELKRDQASKCDDRADEGARLRQPLIVKDCTLAHGCD